MHIFSNRPLFTSCMIFIACSVLGYFIPPQISPIIISVCAIGLAVSVVLILAKRYSKDRKHAFLCLILSLMMAMLSFSSSFIHYKVNIESREQMSEQKFRIDAVVISEESQSNFASKYVIEVSNIENIRDPHKALLVCNYAAALQVGDMVTVNAVASLPEKTTGRYNEKVSLYSDNIFVIYTSPSEDTLDITQYASNDTVTFGNINSRLSSILTSLIGGEEGNLSSALLLGNKHLLSDVTQRDFRRAGASHILALSGLHMSIIMGLAMFIMKRITQKRWLIAIILSAFALTYLGITGFSLSATRAVIMLLIVYLSMLISGVPDSLTSLSIAGVVILLISPGAVVDAGFWMSFSATLGILVYLTPINDYLNECAYKYDNKFRRTIHKLFNSVILSFATGLAAILPLISVMCIFSKELSYASILSSVILSVPTTLIIFLSLILIPLQSIPFLSYAIIEVIKLSAKIMFDYCAFISDKENVVVSLNYPFAAVMAIVLGAALLYSFIVKRNNPFLTLVPFAICIILFASFTVIYEHQNHDKLKISYFDASSNSDMMVLSNERDAIICDISNGSMSSYWLALNEIYESRATEIDAIMLTRYTNQHASTLLSVFQSNKVRELWVPYPIDESEYSKMERIYQYAVQNGVDVFVYNYGDSLYAFEHTVIESVNDYIDRSTVPISVVTVFTGKDQLTYASPALNECDIKEKAEFYFSKSKYVIFGNRGPKTKTEYTIENSDKIRAIAFADEIRAGFFVPPERIMTSYYLVDEEIEFYLDK